MKEVSFIKNEYIRRCLTEILEKHKSQPSTFESTDGGGTPIILEKIFNEYGPMHDIYKTVTIPIVQKKPFNPYMFK